MRTYALPILSGVFLIAAGYPLYLWPLSFIALVPFFYFSGNTERTSKQVFIGGGITGFIIIFFIVCCTLFRLQIELNSPSYYLFVYLCGVIISIFVSLVFGVAAYLFKALKTTSLFCTVLLGAALYTSAELGIQLATSGYYYGSIAHELSSFPPAMLFASVGGEFFVSFLAALFSALLAEVWREKKLQKKYSCWSVAALVCLVLAIGVGAYYLRVSSIRQNLPISVSVVQFSNTQWHLTSYGMQENGVFSDPSAEQAIHKASKDTSLVIYPYNTTSVILNRANMPADPPVFVDRKAIGTWLSALASTSTTVVLWNNLEVNNNEKYSELTYWQNNQESVYQKRVLHPFSDYMPLWLQRIGFTESPHSYKAGDPDSLATVNGSAVGSLICSEVEGQSLARFDATRSSFLISVGSDAIFPGSISGNYSLASARYRAAENNIPVIRGNIIGPSAIINADGSIQTILPYDTSGTLRGVVDTTKNKTTLFGRFGSTPLYLLLAGILLLAVGQKLLKRS